MARTMAVLLWACSAFVFLTHHYPVNGLGVNWGTQMAQNLDPSVVVQLLKDNKINKVKLFDSDHWTVKHFAGSGIEVMLGIPNNQLSKFSDDFDHAKDWVKENVSSLLYDGGVDIKYIAVGNEPFLKSYNGSFMKTTFPSLQNVQKAINDAGLGDKIKVTIPQNADVYDSGTDGPSKGNFRSDIRDLMVKIVKHFNDNNAPFLVNIYPFLSLHDNPDFPIEFAFFDGGATPVQDGNTMYTNMFDANLDTLAWSLKKAGVPNVEIMVGEIGWPTDGAPNANIKMAKKFYDGFLKKMATNKGTPLHPGYIETYLFSLTDENQKSIDPGNFERHWGIFQYDGKPKFPMDFTGQGNDKMPVAAKNVQYLPAQWCVYNDDIKNTTNAVGDIKYACSLSDCTSLYYGSSCNKLSIVGNISYAFNMYYQMNNQDFEACQFDGKAKLTKQDPSKGDCRFPIAIQSAAVRWTGANVFMGLLMMLALFF